MDTTANKPADVAAKDERASASLRTLIDDAEQLLKTTARAGDERFESARERLHDELLRLHGQLTELEAAAGQKVRKAAHATDHAVHDHPYAAMGLAAVTGLLLGVVLGRR